MSQRPTTLERAFDLARSGDCANVGEIVKRLSQEGFATGQVTGPSLVRQLRKLCETSRAAPKAEPVAPDFE